jgi:hypothetical protein
MQAHFLKEVGFLFYKTKTAHVGCFRLEMGVYTTRRPRRIAPVAASAPSTARSASVAVVFPPAPVFGTPGVMVDPVIPGPRTIPFESVICPLEFVYVPFEFAVRPLELVEPEVPVVVVVVLPLDGGVPGAVAGLYDTAMVWLTPVFVGAVGE